MSFISKGDGRKIVALSFCEAQFYFKENFFSHNISLTRCNRLQVI